MTRGRAGARALFVFSPFAIAYGCILPSFERIPDPGDDAQGGEAGNGGSAGSAGTGGNPSGGVPSGGQGTMGGEAGAPGGDGGSAGAPGPISVYKQYVVEQGTNLGVPATQGLFVYSGTDDRDWTSVLRWARDPSLPGRALLDIDPNDGSFTFEPNAELFGVYHATYELGNAGNETATGDLFITVQPVAVDLGDVVNGVGGFTVTGQSAEGIGSAVASAGDVDGDGFDDFLVGAPLAAAGAGRVYLVFGGRERDPVDLDPSPSAGARYSVIQGARLDALGTSVAGAGDLDGDGRGDFVLGAPGDPGAGDGRAYVVFGRDRAELTGSITDIVSAGGFALERPGAIENVGGLVAGGDDLTGDDVPDLVVFVKSSGAFYVVDGTASSNIDLGSDSAGVFHANPTDTADYRGLSLLGDVDGDDTGELMVGTGSLVALLRGPPSGYPATLAGAFTMSHGVRVGPSAGAAFVSLSRAGDFDGDGIGDGVFCHALNFSNERCHFLGLPGSSTDGISVTGFGSGSVSVAGGGDTSGDRFADLLFSETDGAVSSAWVIFGRSQLGSMLNVQNLGVQGFSISGGTDIQTVALGGNIDGPARDGSSTADWLVGDTGAAGGNGRVSVIFGGEFSR